MASTYFRFARVAVMLLLLVSPLSAAQAASDAICFIENRATTVIDMFNDRSLSPDEREARLHALAVESFDVPSIARWVLGRYWLSATLAERQEFTKEFEHYMVHAYAGRFGLYPDAKFKSLGERPENDRTLVHSAISWRGSNHPAKIDWWVKRAKNGYKILDVSIEGVSQLLLWRDEFASVIQQHDGQVAGLIEHLKEKTGG